MKKLLNALMCTVLSCAMLLGVAACGGGTAADKKNMSLLKISIFNGGYGYDWLQTVANNFKAYYNDAGEQYEIKIEPTPLGERTSEISSGSCSYDLVFQVGTMFANTNVVHDLTDVYNSTPEGESKTIREKLNPAYDDYLNVGTEQDPMYTQMIWADGRMGIVYNETVIDNALGKGQWQVPNTTDELLALCDRLKAAGVWAWVNSNNLGTYTPSILNTWWAQYEGWDNYMAYYQGTPYVDGKPVPDNVSQQGRLESLEVFERIFKKSNGYIHPDSDTLSYTSAQIELVGIRVDGNKVPSAMMINGDWLESEASAFMKASGETVKFMQAPVVSALGEKIGLTDAQLSELVAYSRGEKDNLSFTATEAQKEAVGEAVRIVYAQGNQHVVVAPKSSKKIDLIKKFLVFMYSNPSQAVYSRALNGLTMPYGYNPSDSDGVKTSTFVGSWLEQNDVNFIYNDDSSILVYRGGVVPWNAGGSYLTNMDRAFFAGTSAQSVFEASESWLTGRWQTVLNNTGFGG